MILRLVAVRRSMEYSRCLLVATLSVLWLANVGCGGNSFTGSNLNSGIPNATMVPASLNFGDVAIGSSIRQTATLSSNGSAPLIINAINATGDFSQTNSCGSSLAAGTSCTVVVTFKPTAPGSRTGMVTIADNSSGSPHQITLAGTGITAPVPAASVAPASLSFGDQVINTGSSSQTVTLTNTGNAVLSISSIADSGDYSQANNCGNSLAAGANCTIVVIFTPTALGTRTGAVTITDNAAGSPHQVSLSGTGVSAPSSAATVTPTSLSFGNQVINTTSNSQAVALSNTGNTALTISNVGIMGDFAQTGNCGATLPAASSCTFAVTFTPTATGDRTGTLSITAGTTQFSITLTGTGDASMSHYVIITWTPSTSSVVGYNVYRSSQSGGPYTKINAALVTAASYTDSSVSSGLTYFYVVTSVDADNIESGFSNEAVATIPTP